MVGCEWCRVEEVARGVYAVVDVDGGWFRSNSVLVDMGGFTLVVDTQYNEPRARDLQRLISRLGLPKRVLVVNTHHHGDHAWGNHVFEGPSIMSEGASRAVEALMGIAPDIYKPFFPHLDFTGSKYTPPTITVRAEATIRGEKRIARLRLLPPAHTVGDMVVELPDDKVLITGDLAFNGVTPLALDGTVTGWDRVLEELQKEYEGWVIIPGHGPIASTQTIAMMRAYFRHLQGSVGYLLERGTPRDPLKLAVEASPGPLLGWKDPERLVLNIARLLMDLEGVPPGAPPEDLPGLAAKMMEYARILEEQVREGRLPRPPEGLQP